MDTQPDFSEKKDKPSGNPLQRLSRSLTHLAGSIRLPQKDSHPDLQE